MSKIEWTNKTWNPIVGCEKISEGCKNCYAEKFAKRLVNNPNPKIANKYMSVIAPNGWTGYTHLEESELENPSHWKKTAMIFVCSMGDLFHESVPFEWIEKVFNVIATNPQHIYQVLTKRPEIALEYFKYFGNEIKKAGFDSIPSQSSNPFDYYDPLPNVWIGTTIENQSHIKRIEDLLNIPTQVKFLSAEPLLSDIKLSTPYYNFLTGIKDVSSHGINKSIQDKKIDWVITGPETGPGARPCKKEWIESLYQQCKVAGVPFFDKKNILGLNIKEFPK